LEKKKKTTKGKEKKTEKKRKKRKERKREREKKKKKKKTDKKKKNKTYRWNNPKPQRKAISTYRAEGRTSPLRGWLGRVNRSHSSRAVAGSTPRSGQGIIP
jgi:hypothetical protein